MMPESGELILRDRRVQHGMLMLRNPAFGPKVRRLSLGLSAIRMLSFARYRAEAGRFGLVIGIVFGYVPYVTYKGL